ncbi:translation initiation factor IF-2 subunit beta [Candidatus Micrarchaeota archaeon]|nr:translation initiation factor IF-2 subunit beta [Candidatus Micrarchaeota archaeon]
MVDYENLLDRVYSSLPEKKSSSERFEIPQADIFVEGNKTMIKNFDEICSRLRREPREVAKYLFKELATPGQVQGGRLVLQRKLYYKSVNEKIVSYIESCVLCKECKKPDTHTEAYDRNVKLLVCEACGARSPIRI